MNLTKKDREALNHIKMMRKEQIATLDKLKIPLQDNLKNLEMVLHNQQDIRAFIHHCKTVNKYLMEFKKVF
jgi:hypothetical protein